MNVARRVGTAIAGTAIVLMVAAGSTLAATTLTYSPATATPGTRVTIENACLGVTDHPAARIGAAFVNVTVEVPPTTFKRQAFARAIAGTTEYVVVVPNLAPGRYQIVLECLPGNWLTNTAEGGTEPLVVVAGVPNTATAPASGVASGSDRPPDGLVLLGAGLLGLIVARTRFEQRERRRS